ncbi:hypothetical protein SNE40_010258 [Patella caerulea]|uniref:Angiotensin-converting enzyme n=3 Tax=Patella caerulea TaxID=87958 RepID=A0AAN8JXK5_PATCE
MVKVMKFMITLLISSCFILVVSGRFPYQRYQHLDQRNHETAQSYPEINQINRWNEERNTLLEELTQVLIEYFRDESTQASEENKRATLWLRKKNSELEELSAINSLLQWNFATNITHENEEKLSLGQVQSSKWYANMEAQGKNFNMANLDDINRRQLRLLLKSANPNDINIVRETSDTSSEMLATYNTGKVCMKDGNCLPLEPDIQDIMSKSRKPEQLLEAWKGWRDVTSPIKPLYTKFVELKNEGAKEHGYNDFGEFWRDSLFDQTPDLEASAERIWEEIQPLYQELHAYVRNKLRSYYGEKVVGSDGALPAHILGNMWAQQWTGIYDILKPYSSADYIPQTEAELKKKYDVKGLFRLSEEFFSSIGLYNMTDKFWNNTMMVKPEGREVQCHASAFYLYRRGDFRIKMCAEVSLDYLETIHHEMGHIEYYMAYEDQPAVFRDGANSAFHEAVGDTIALSVTSRPHLKTIALLNEDSTESKKSDIDMLLQMSLNKLAFLPFGYLVDKWRWAVFKGEVTEANYNKYWWQLRLKYQGVVSPIPRSENDFDPAAKFHIPANSPYMSYFFSHILQFQFYQRLCDLSGHEGELHTCDFYESKRAGSKLKEMLALGSSVPWQDALEQFTGSREVSAKPLIEYFRPLMTWLRAENKKYDEKPGWKDAKINWLTDDLFPEWAY